MTKEQSINTFKRLKNGTSFKILGLNGVYKANHDRRIVTAYNMHGATAVSIGKVNGLYDSLMIGGWIIK